MGIASVFYGCVIWVLHPDAFYGEFLFNAQGEDVVAGIRTPLPIAELKNKMPKIYDELVAIYKHDTPGQTPDKRRIQIVKKAVKEALGIEEADYHGRSVSLNKPMKGDIKKSKVYVKDPKSGNIKKVEFGDPNMTIKKHIPARRKSFRARHHCDTNPGPKTKARYWSCRAW